MRKLFFLLLAAVTTLGVQALTVNNTAGQLSQKVSNLQITELTVTGTMNAEDFLFITEKLNELTSVNLSQVRILPMPAGTMLYGTSTNYPANEIPRTAFFGKKLMSLTLPSTIESIGFAAFAGCYQLRSVTFPTTLAAIDDYAFAGCALTSVNIPASVKVMGKGVFSRCESLTSATIDAELIGGFTFLGDFNLSQVNIGPDVKRISKGMFNGCTALKSLNVDPACRMNRIDEEAFINSGLENIDIPSLGVGTIGEWALAQTKLSSVELSDGMTVLGDGALAHNPLLQSVTLPGMGHNSGPRRAPHRPHTIAEVSDYTFAGDGVLNPDLLREGVTSIGNYAFYNVSTVVDTMWLPSTVTYLGDMAMAGMTGMQTLRTDAVDVPALGSDVWAGVDQPSVPLVTPKESTALYKAADQWLNFFFEAEAYKIGDVNGDGNVNISDVTTLINYLLNGDPTGVNLLAADVNQDGNINISDVTSLINMLLNGSSSMSLRNIRSQVASQSLTTDDGLALPVVSLRPGETRTVDVELINNDQDYSAMRCEVKLPDDVELVSVAGVDRGASHNFYMSRNEVEANVYTIMAASMNMATFAGNEGNVMRLTIKASNGFSAQDFELMLTNIVLVASTNEGFLANDAMAMIKDNSGIEIVGADKEIDHVRYINVAGMESDIPFDGVNIVVTTYTDGTITTTKVIK